ncbi:MAG: PrsW family glutamic-type intramembrane protease [Candidatus Kariarchaeaceae archaeon]
MLNLQNLNSSEDFSSVTPVKTGPISRQHLVIPLVLFFIIFSTSYIFGEYISPTKDYSNSILRFLQENINVSRFIFVLMGPILSFGFYLSVATIIFYEELKRVEIRIILQYSIIASLISLLFAITLNSRAILIALLVAVGFDERIGIFFFAAIIPPIVEETAKALPIYYLARSYATQPGVTKERKLIQNMSIPVYVGTITGAMFNLLETYWYTWNLGYIFQIKDQENWHSISFQIILRSLNPLHVLNACLSGFGIGIMLWRVTSKTVRLSDFRHAFPYFFAGMFLHGLWNGSAVLSPESSYIRFFGDQLPLFNLGLIFVSLLGLSLLWARTLQFSSTKCSICDEWHEPPYTSDVHIMKASYRSSSIFKLYQVLLRRSKRKHCMECKLVYVGQQCTCTSTHSFICKNCYSPIPVYQDRCWKCKIEISPVYTKVLDFSEDNITRGSKAFILVLVGFYLPTALSYLILLTNDISAGDQVSADFEAIRFLFLLILGFALLIITKWSIGDKNQAMGISLSRMVTGMVIFQFSIIFLFVGLSFWIISSLLITPLLILTGFLFIIEGIIIAAVSLDIIFGFRAVFHLPFDQGDY